VLALHIPRLVQDPRSESKADKSVMRVAFSATVAESAVGRVLNPLSLIASGTVFGNAARTKKEPVRAAAV